MTNTTTILEHFDLVTFTAPCWNGKRALDQHERAQFMDADMPDSRHWIPGAKTLVFPDRLRAIASRRPQIDALLRTRGTRFHNFFAVRSLHMPDIVKQMNDHIAAYNNDVDHFLANLDDYYDEVVEDLLKNGRTKWADMVRSSQIEMPAAKIRAKSFGASYFVFNLGTSKHAPAGNELMAVDTLFESVCADIFAGLRSHIAKVNDNPIKGIFRVDARGAFEEVATKARTFDFLPNGDALVRFAEMCDHIALGTGKVAGDEYQALVVLLSGVEDAETMAERVRSLTSGSSSVSNKFDILIKRHAMAIAQPADLLTSVSKVADPAPSQPVAPVAPAPATQSVDPTPPAPQQTDPQTVSAVDDADAPVQPDDASVPVDPFDLIPDSMPIDDASSEADSALASTDDDHPVASEAPATAPSAEATAPINPPAADPVVEQPKPVLVAQAQHQPSQGATVDASQPHRRERVRRVVPV